MEEHEEYEYLHKRKKMRKKKLVFLVLIPISVLIIIGFFLKFLVFNDLEVSADFTDTTVSKRTMDETIVTSGTVQPLKEQYEYYEPGNGVIGDIKVKEGQKVKAGDQLYIYKNEELELQEEKGKIAKQRILLQLEQLNNKKKNIKEDIIRIKKNKEKSNTNEEEVLANSINSLPEEEISQLEDQLEDVNFQIREANLSYKENELQIEDLNKKREDLVIKADFEGVVESENFNNNTSADNTSPLIHIISNSSIIQGELSEYDYPYIEEGQKVKVEAKAYSGSEWKGEVKSKSTQSNAYASMEGEASNVSSYTFTISINDAESKLVNGFNTNIEIETNKKNVVAVPYESILKEKDEEGKTQQFVYVFDSINTIKKRKVMTGIISGDWIEVTEGLIEDERIVESPSPHMYDGMEVVNNDKTP